VPIIDAYAFTLRYAGKIYTPGIVTKYWDSMQSSDGHIYYEGGRRRHGHAVPRRYLSQRPWVEILTWNDFDESYMMPMDDFGKYNDWDFRSGSPTVLGYAELLRYYIAWFRTAAQLYNETLQWRTQLWHCRRYCTIYGRL
jgi:hypothetical protein